MTLGGIRSRLVMENIIKTDQADVIGLGRPFAVNLSALQGLLDGTTDFLPSKDISTGSQLLDVRLLFVVVAVFQHLFCSWDWKLFGMLNNSTGFVQGWSQI